MNLSKLREMGKDRGAWRAGVHEVAKGWTRLSDGTPPPVSRFLSPFCFAPCVRCHLCDPILCPSVCVLGRVGLCDTVGCSPPGSGGWSGLLCPPPGNLPDRGMEPESVESPALAIRYFTTSAPGKPVTSLLPLALTPTLQMRKVEAQSTRGILPRCRYAGFLQ